MVSRGAPDLDPDPGSGRIWIRPHTKILGSGTIRIRPDPNSLDPVNRIHYHVLHGNESGFNRIHYHVVPITVSMHFVLSPNDKQQTSDKLH